MTDKAIQKLHNDILKYNERILASIYSTEKPSDPRWQDLTGKTFGIVHVDYFVGRGEGRRLYWQCTCQCGNHPIRAGNRLLHKNFQSCGCINREISSQHGKKYHTCAIGGDSHSRLYSIWKSVRERTNNPKAAAYPLYGGRGIKMCAEWYPPTTGYLAFKKWSLENGYEERTGKDKLTLDRIDTNGDYCPENCRWITNTEQQWNRRNNHLLYYEKYVYPIAIWAIITGNNAQTIYFRIMAKMDIRDILFKIPSKKQRGLAGYYQFNRALAEEFQQFNKYNEWVREGKIAPFEYSKIDREKLINISENTLFC